MSRKESLLRGAAVLAVAGLIIKVSNLLVRIPLTRLIRAEGLGIYQMALPAFWASYHLASGGVPVAVQNLVAEYTDKDRRRAAHQVVQMALRYTVLAGGAAAVVLLIIAEPLARLLGEPRAYLPLVALAPAVVLSAADSIYRSYLQGRRLMTPSAVASILEQGTKILATVAAAFFLIRYGVAYGAAGAALGITAGAVVSLAYMIFAFRHVSQEDGPDRSRPEPRAPLAGRMIRLAWPVTAGSVLMPLLNLLDVGVVQQGFQRAGYSLSQATALFGAISGIALQVVMFPLILTNALTNALVPVLAAAKARKDKAVVASKVLLGLRMAGLIGLPSALGIATLAEPIAGLFGDPTAAIPLRYLAPVAYLGPLAWLLAGQLQALGITGVPMRNFAIGLVVKIGLDVALAPIPGVGVVGVSLDSSAMFLIISWLNLRALERELEGPMPWTALFAGPLAASAVMGGVLFGVARGGLLPRADWAAIAVALVLAPVIYLVFLIATRAVTWREIRAISGPVGAKLERWFQAFWSWG